MYAAQRVVRTPEWTYQRTYHPGVFEHAPVSLWAADDVHQLRDVAAGHPSVVEALQQQLSDWRSTTTTATGQPDPMDEVLGTGGPFRYVRPDRWARTLREQNREADADRMLARIAEQGLDRVDA